MPLNDNIKFHQSNQVLLNPDVLSSIENKVDINQLATAS